MFYSDLTDKEWAAIKPVLPPQKPKSGRPALDHRTVINAILWVKCNGYPWRDLPARYGKWSTAASRYHRWTRAGIWDHIAVVLAANSNAACRRESELHGASRVMPDHAAEAGSRLNALAAKRTAY
jgi:transposase